MSNDKNKFDNEKKVVPITPEQSEKINEILKVFADMIVSHAKESRDKKSMGGLTDKPLYVPNPNEVDEIIPTMRERLRARYAEGGDTDFPGPDDPIGQTKYMISVLTPPKDSYQAFLLEQLESDLKKLQSKGSK